MADPALRRYAAILTERQVCREPSAQLKLLGRTPMQRASSVNAQRLQFSD
jgi:hypothetical protein